MIFFNDLQSLIDDIDSILLAQDSASSWSRSINLEREHLLLAKIRKYLLVFQNYLNSSSQSLTNSSESIATQEITRSIIAAMDLRVNDWRESFSTDLENLHQQRESLLREIRQLETQRQQIVSDLLEMLVDRCSDKLEQQISQTWQKLENRLSNNSTSFEPTNRLLLNVDNSLRGVFTILENNLQGYCQSLSQGLERMHNLGQQSESQLTEYINNLTEKFREQLNLAVFSESEYLERVEAETENFTDFTGFAEQIRQLEGDASAIFVSAPAIIEEMRFKPWEPPTTIYTKSKVEAVIPSSDRIRLLTDLLNVNFTDVPAVALQTICYLGIDFTSSGIIAVLLHATLEGQSFTSVNQYPIYWSSTSVLGEIKSSFRLSPKIYDELISGNNNNTSLLIDNLKYYLNLPISQYYHQTDSVNNSRFSFYQIEQAVKSLFATLTKDNNSPIILGAIELSSEFLQTALANLNGIVISVPAMWDLNYRSNLEEIILETELVETPQQIFFLEEAVASLLAHLPLEDFENFSPTSVTTLVIKSGAMSTEFALVDLPGNLHSLTHDLFTLTSLNYGGQDLDLDIFYQLIYPQWQTHLQPPLAISPQELPSPGKSESQKRDYASLSLQNHPLGNSFLEAAKLVKLILQEQEQFSSSLDFHPWQVRRQDLDTKVINPFLREIQSQLSQLLAQKRKSPSQVSQIICTGGTINSLWRLLMPVLQNQFVNANIIYDRDEHNFIQVAFGLSRLPLFDHLESKF